MDLPIEREFIGACFPGMGGLGKDTGESTIGVCGSP